MENPFEIIIEKLNAIEKRLDNIELKTLKSKSVTERNTIMNVKELSEYLNLAIATIYSKVSRGEIPYMKRSNKLYFELQVINTWLRKGRVRTNDEIDELADEFLSNKKFKFR